MIKTLSTVGVDGTCLNKIKAIYDKPLATSYSTGKTTSIPFKIGDKTGMSAFISLVQHSTGSPRHTNQARRNEAPKLEREK